MEKRSLVAIFLSMMVLLIWGYFEQKSIQKRQMLRKQVELEAEKAKAPVIEAEKAPKAEMGIIAGTERALTGTPSYKGGEPGPVKDVIVENDLAIATFTNLGGRLKSYQLKEYKDKDGRRLEMVPEMDYSDLPLALDLRQSSGKLVTAQGLELDSTLFNSRVNRALYEVNVDGLVVNDFRPTGKLMLAYHDGGGIKVIKEFTFYRDKYAFDVDVRIEGLARYPGGFPYRLFWGTAVNQDKQGRRSPAYIQVITFNGRDRTKYKAAKLKEAAIETQPVKWAAIGSKYFVAAILSGDTVAPAVLRREGGDKIALGMTFGIREKEGSPSRKLYVGPKEPKRLEGYGVSLEKAIDYGWTPFGETVTRGIAKPLLAVLIWFYSFTNNYGLAIILLTVVIKAAFYPLTEKSFVAMQRMQGLQPKVRALQERYRNDRQRLNQEMMQLYRTHKANPMGGCLPILAQLPIFYSLYVVLMYSIELRQAPFFLWIKDLSDYDHFFVTPILMGVTMFFQQKMTPTVGDPRQAKMMLMMPVIFTVMFIYFPVGLVIYWLINNLLTIAQQYFIKRRMAAATARRKNEGGTIAPVSRQV